MINDYIDIFNLSSNVQTLQPIRPELLPGSSHLVGKLLCFISWIICVIIFISLIIWDIILTRWDRSRDLSKTHSLVLQT